MEEKGGRKDMEGEEDGGRRLAGRIWKEKKKE